MTQQVPESWAVAPLGEIADVQLGKMLSAKARGGHGTRPYLRNINVRWHRIDVSDVLGMDFDSREVGKYQLQAGDVLVCEGGEPGRAAIWREQLPGALYQKALHRVRFRNGVLDPRLFTHYLELAATTGRLARRFTGSTIKHLPREAFLGLEVSIPPLAEQRRIIDALEEHLSDLDAAVAGLERARANVRRYGDALREEALRGCDEVPLFDLLRDPLSNGRSVPTAPTGFPVLRLTALRGGRVDLAEHKVGAWTANDARSFLVTAGDFLIARGNGSKHLVGRGGLVGSVDFPVAYPDTLIRARVDEMRILPEFLRLAWDSRRVRAQIESMARTTAGIYKVNQRGLERVRVPVREGLQDQRAVVAQVDRHLAVAERTAAEIDVQLARAKRLRHSILKHAFDGELVTQDPADEPASALLDRIRGGRAAEPPRRPRAEHSARPRT